MFNKFFIIAFLFFAMMVLCTIIVCFSDMLFQDERLKNSPHYNKIKLVFRIVIVTVAIIMTILKGLPIYKDKKLMSQNSYECTHGVVSQEVLGGGVYGLFKTIIIDVDDNDVVYCVLYADKNIKKGDLVKVTYLPNSKYAIVELQ